MNENSSVQLTVEECLKNFRHTRDFDLYLDMLNVLKKEYLIILSLRNTSDQNISEQTVGKIRRLGFSRYTTEPNMKYAGISENGTMTCDMASKIYEPPICFKGYACDIKVQVSFEANEPEISIGGREQCMDGKGVNIAVFDLKKNVIADVCCYNVYEEKPAFYHRNFFCDKRYIDTHVYMPESYIETVTLPLKRSYFSSRSLNVTEVERGIFLPTADEYERDELGKKTETYKAYGGICDESFNFIAGHQLFSPRYIDLDDRHIVGSYKVEPEKITYIDETVLYAGSMLEHPGHLILECFADRLWWLAQNPDSDIKIAVEIVWEQAIPTEKPISFVREYFYAFGVPEERLIFIDRPTQFKKIIIPDQSSIPLNYCFPYEFTNEYIKPFRQITEQLTPGMYKKIYLTKSKSYKKMAVGEEYFIDFFEKRGFKIIHPEDHTIKEKAELMYGADEVVTVDGTNSLFTVFCKPTVRLTILTRRLDFWDYPQQQINEALGIKEFYLVNTSGNFLENFSGNAFKNYSGGMTYMYVTKEFKRYVKDVYNEELDIVPEESIKEHIHEYLTDFFEYYSKPNFFHCVKDIKMMDILRSMSEVFEGRSLNTGGFDMFTDDERRIKKLELRLSAERETSAKKINSLTEKAKELIDENVSLKRSLAKLEAENRQLRDSNAEMTSYMAEISSLLDSLEAGNGSEE